MIGEDVPVQYVDDLLDLSRGYVSLGRQGGDGRLAITRYDGGGNPLGHLAITRAEAPKVIAALSVLAANEDPRFEDRFREALLRAERNVEREV